MKRRLPPKLTMALSMAIFGTIAPFVRRIGVSSGELALYRAVLAALVIGLVLLLRGKRPSLGGKPGTPVLLLLSGAALGFNWILLFEAYKYTTVSTATLSYYFAPVLITLACPVLFRERIGPKQWLCSAMATLGIVLITGTGAGAGSDQLLGIAFGLGAACLYATVVLLNKFIRNADPLCRTLLQFVAAIAVLIPYVALSGGFHPQVLDGTGWGCLLIVGLVHTGLAYCMYFSALKEVPGQKAAILSYIDPVVAVAVSVTLLSEPMTPVQVLGGVLVLGFTLYNELSPKNTPQEETP